MIELSLDVLNNIVFDIDKMSGEELYAKYNVDINVLENSISDHIDKYYINNNIYHIFPILSISMLVLNTFLFSYFM